MKKLYLALIPFFLLFCFDSASGKGRIYGGYPINITDAPYMVHVVIARSQNPDGTTNVYECGGTILKKNIILTAGHCKKVMIKGVHERLYQSI
jgi:secreted trypsin-like serine protease